MSLLFESIRLFNGEFENLPYHQTRMDHARQDFLGLPDTLSLRNFLSKQEKPTSGLFKCRVEYGQQINQVEFVPYHLKEIKTLKLVEGGSIDYRFKLSDRSAIIALFNLRENCDDVLIVKNGLVTDSSYCNMVFRKGNSWITPSTPLLKGTMRQKLLDEGKIVEEEIRVDQILVFDAFTLINAMVGWPAGEMDVRVIS
jgi:4-amino-4-deoxychorismate lyase